jgi:hypothetical protein
MCQAFLVRGVDECQQMVTSADLCAVLTTEFAIVAQVCQSLTMQAWDLCGQVVRDRARLREPNGRVSGGKGQNSG